jgi:uncharacterized integral membrane protein
MPETQHPLLACENNDGQERTSSDRSTIPQKESETRISWLAWTAFLFTVGFLILTLVYASSATATSHIRFLYNSSSKTIFVLSVLSSITGLFLTATIAATFERVQWLLISRPNGVRLSRYLSLQPGTGLMGLLVLVFGGSRAMTKMWAVVRLVALSLVPILSIVIMSNVNTRRVFNILEDTPATLGWGMSPFNGTLAQNVSVVADYVVQADLAMFLSQPYRSVDITPRSERMVPCEHIPGNNNTKNCRRVYYMPGGLELAATQEVKNIVKTEIVVAENQQGYILDFTEGPDAGGEWIFEAEGGCQVYGFPFGAFHLCLKNAGSNTLQARIVHCPTAVSSHAECITNTTWPSAPGWTTSLTTSFRNASVAYSIRNGTILSHTYTSDPIPAAVSAAEMLAGYRAAYGRFDDLSTILPSFLDTESTSMFTLYVYPAVVAAHLTSTLRLSEQDPAVAPRAQDTIQCLLAIMLYYCQPSLFSSTLSAHLDPPSSNPSSHTREDAKRIKAFAGDLQARAPPDTKVRQAVPRYQLVVGKATLLAYIVLCGSALLSCLVALAWVEWRIQKEKLRVPRIGPFPAWDEWAMCDIQRGDSDERVQTLTRNGVVKAAEKMTITLDWHDEGAESL